MEVRFLLLKRLRSNLRRASEERATRADGGGTAELTLLRTLPTATDVTATVPVTSVAAGRVLAVDPSVLRALEGGRRHKQVDHGRQHPHTTQHHTSPHSSHGSSTHVHDGSIHGKAAAAAEEPSLTMRARASLGPEFGADFGGCCVGALNAMAAAAERNGWRPETKLTLSELQTAAVVEAEPRPPQYKRVWNLTETKKVFSKNVVTTTPSVNKFTTGVCTWTHSSRTLSQELAWSCEPECDGLKLQREFPASIHSALRPRPPSKKKGGKKYISSLTMRIWSSTRNGDLLWCARN